LNNLLTYTLSITRNQSKAVFSLAFCFCYYYSCVCVWFFVIVSWAHSYSFPPDFSFVLHFVDLTEEEAKKLRKAQDDYVWLARCRPFPPKLTAFSRNSGDLLRGLEMGRYASRSMPPVQYLILYLCLCL
jgi:hypothetical protein